MNTNETHITKAENDSAVHSSGLSISEETLKFITAHAGENIRDLAFKASQAAGVDAPFALNQIAGRQIAQTKLPSWASADGIIYPPHISMEQCSSEQTGEYKAAILQRFFEKMQSVITDNSNQSHDTTTENIAKSPMDSHVFYDFTGGFGVDFSFLGRLFGECIYIERQEHLCDIARHNFPLLGLKDAKVINADAEELFFATEEGASNADSATQSHPYRLKNAVVFIDPARRDVQGKRTYAIADCTPNILGFIGILLDNADIVMVKLSPMLDYHATVSDINAATACGDVVREVHIVSVNNECKELLLILSSRFHSPLTITCVNDDELFSYASSGNNDDAASHNKAIAKQGEYITLQNGGGSSEEESNKDCKNTDGTDGFLLVPNASIMKAGCFRELEGAFPARQISQNSHLFLADTETKGFPGRQFRISSISSMNKKELRRALAGIEKANIATRNFPLKPEELRKRLKLKDGGDTYIFGTTNAQCDHLLYICTKV